MKRTRRTRSAGGLIVGLALCATALTASGVATAQDQNQSEAMPSDILDSAGVPRGFARGSDAATDLDYAQFAPTSPYSVDHIQAGSVEAGALVAASDVWALGDDTLLREVIRWDGQRTATGYVDAVAAYAVGRPLDEVAGPFDGARGFTGLDPVGNGWVRITVWSEGDVGAAVTHFHDGPEPRVDLLHSTARALAEAMRSTSAGATLTTDEDGTDIVTIAVIVGGIIAISILLLVLRRIRRRRRLRRAATAIRASRLPPPPPGAPATDLAPPTTAPTSPGSPPPPPPSQQPSPHPSPHPSPPGLTTPSSAPLTAPGGFELPTRTPRRPASSPPPPPPAANDPSTPPPPPGDWPPAPPSVDD